MAGEAVDNSGVRFKQATVIGKLIKMFSGRTTAELAALGKDPSKIRRRIARRMVDCEQMEVAHRGPIKLCSVSMRQAISWFPGKHVNDGTCICHCTY